MRWPWKLYTLQHEAAARNFDFLVILAAPVDNSLNFVLVLYRITIHFFAQAVRLHDSSPALYSKKNVLSL